MEADRRVGGKRVGRTSRVCVLPGEVSFCELAAGRRGGRCHQMSGFSLQGLDSPGGDYMVVEGGGGDVGRLREACMQTYRCIGE